MIAETSKTDHQAGGGSAGPAERRGSPRYQIDLPGRVDRVDGVPLSCRVRDYCNGGMLLHLLDAADGKGNLAIEQQVKLEIELLGPLGPRPIRIAGRIVWLRGEHAGLFFVKPSAALTAALLAYDRQTKDQPDIGPRGTASRFDEARCLARLRRLTEGALPDLAHELLLDTIEDLPAAAERETSTLARERILGEISLLGAPRARGLLDRLLLERAFDEPCRTPMDEARPEERLQELSLLALDDFERWLETSRAASLLENRLDPSRAAIGARLAAASGTDESGRLAALLEPQPLTRAVGELATQLELGVTTRQVLFSSAVRVLGDRLPRLHQSLHAELDVLGVPVALTLRERGAMHATRLTGGESIAPNRGASPSGAAAGAAPDGSAGPAPTASGDSAGALAPAGPRAALAYELVGRIGNGLARADHRPDWLTQLEGPLVRAAAADLTFFQNPEHPLRAILDRLAYLELFRGPADAGPAEEMLRERVAGLLAPVRNGSADAVALRAILVGVAELAAELSGRFQREVERVIADCDARELARRARLEVAAEIDRRYAGAPVPEVAAELLEVGWRVLIERDWIGARGELGSCDGRLAVLDALIGTLGGRAYDPVAPIAPPAALLDRISAALAGIALDPFRCAALETRLRQELLDPAAAPARLVAMPKQVVDRDPAEAMSRPEDLSVDEWERLLARSAAIRIGDRLRLLDEAADRRYLRVAWIRVDRAVFVLVDHRGQKTRDIWQADLALGLHQQRIQLEPVDGRSLTERMVGAMLEGMEAQLPHMTEGESFTGLIGHRQFRAALEAALAASGRSADPGVLLMVDIDQFRLVNEIHGYETGDRLLTALAQLLRSTTGAEVIGHIGGDRFAVLLPGVDLADAEAWADRLCGAVRVMPFAWTSHGLGLSISVGLVAVGAAAQGLGDLWQAAEQAVRVAKRAGGDRAFVYRADSPDIARHKECLYWVAEVDKALDSGELHLRCQPIVPVHPERGLVPHYEVLLGVRSGSPEPLPISHFIAAAERYKRMRAVDRWVTKTVIEWIAAHRQDMARLHGFAVNLSGQTVSDPSFVDFVREQIRRAGIEPSWVSFEVTETAAIADLSVSSGIIRDLKALGCPIALDDFGSGLASYSYLRGLPVDWVKIDGAFVRKIVLDRDDYAVVKSINEIGHVLGKLTIAEYVADTDILGRVTEIGVDFAQGYGISPPLPMDELAGRYRSRAAA